MAQASCLLLAILLGTALPPPDINAHAKANVLDAAVADQPSSGEEDSPEPPRRWFILPGLVNVYPKLERERLIKELFDPLVGFMAPGYSGSKTFTDMRDDGLLWPPQLAVGRVLSDKFALSIHGGYSAGTVRTRKSNPSLLLGVPLHTRVKIRRYAAFVGLDLDYYPLGMVEMKRYESWGSRLGAAKPTLGARITWTWAGYDAQIGLGLGLARRVFNLHLHEDWALPSLTLVAGLDIPLNRRSVLILNGGYTFFKDQRQDFNGPAFTIGWRFMF